jgi:predicted nucleotide-binding protein (sugar kinase/HSP70/actin superfamily)
MVLGFPSMGRLDEVVRTFIESFGIKSVPTPRTTQMCVELGREIAPEFVCFPFTATLGQMRYMLEHGANTLLMVGGKGYCRLGWYAQVQEQLLRNLGYDFELLVVDSPFPIRDKWSNFNRMIKQATGNAPWPRILAGLYSAYHRLATMDRIDTEVHRLRAFERNQGTVDKLASSYLRKLAKATEVRTIRQLERSFIEEAATIETEDTQPLRIRIAGEIWVVLEQSATRNVERWLGSQKRPRVWVERELSTSSWFQANVLRLPSARRREHEIALAAKPWLSQMVGGHGQATIGQVALAPRDGIDGVIHIFPFTCMPEIIAQNIIVPMSEDIDIPVLTYIVSEQTGEAGMETRLESFLDLLEERRIAGCTPTEHTLIHA